MTLTLTVDSNVVINAYEDGEALALSLLEAHPSRAQVAVASRTPFLEATRSRDRLAAAGIPTISSVMRVGTGIIGVDVIVGGHIEASLALIEEILFGDSLDRTHRRFLSNLNDVDIVEAHRRSGNDHLVTLDRDILSARERLQTELGVSAIDVRDALDLVGGAAESVA